MPLVWTGRAAFRSCCELLLLSPSFVIFTVLFNFSNALGGSAAYWPCSGADKERVHEIALAFNVSDLPSWQHVVYRRIYDPEEDRFHALYVYRNISVNDAISKKDAIDPYGYLRNNAQGAVTEIIRVRQPFFYREQLNNATVSILLQLPSPSSQLSTDSKVSHLSGEYCLMLTFALEHVLLRVRLAIVQRPNEPRVSRSHAINSETVLECRMRPKNWPFTDTVIRNQLKVRTDCFWYVNGRHVDKTAELRIGIEGELRVANSASGRAQCQCRYLVLDSFHSAWSALSSGVRFNKIGSRHIGDDSTTEYRIVSEDPPANTNKTPLLSRNIRNQKPTEKNSDYVAPARTNNAIPTMRGNFSIQAREILMFTFLVACALAIIVQCILSIVRE